jgi:DNA mismatch endonuclease (patch repair protein)
MDFLSPTERSKRMSLIRKKNTKPEMLVRSIAHGLGYRFRLHDSRLPGTPDLCFVRLRKIIEVRGCFWHSHACRRSKKPVASRAKYWLPKLACNIERDLKNLRQLKKLGWKVLVLWECQCKDVDSLTRRIRLFLTESKRDS